MNQLYHYYEDTEKKQCRQNCALDGSCEICSSKCRTCFGEKSNQCLTCHEGFTYSKPDLSCLEIVCEKGEYGHLSIYGEAECSKCDSACTECTGPESTDCTKCSPEKMLFDGVCKQCGDGSGNFYFHGTECREKCGKGMVISDKIECDDGNLLNGDGCNDQC